MVKVRSYGALMGALLTIASVESAEAATPAPKPAAATCPCAPAPKQAATVRKVPAPVVRRDAGQAYAQSFYNYRSASRVTEEFVRHAAVGAAPVPQEYGWQVAPNDAHIRFYRDERAVIVPGNAYPPAFYYPPAPAYYAPPPVYTPPGYGPPGYAPSSYAPQDGLDIEQQGFNGGVGAMNGPGGGGGGGGYGGTAYLYLNNGGGSDVPPNGGGVSLPGGYGPTYQGTWQGPVVPTRGGFSGGGGH